MVPDIVPGDKEYSAAVPDTDLEYTERLVDVPDDSLLLQTAVLPVPVLPDTEADTRQPADHMQMAAAGCPNQRHKNNRILLTHYCLRRKQDIF